MRTMTLGACALAAAALLVGCGATTGQGPGGAPSAVSAVDNYCGATTPQLRAIFRLPLIMALDLPAETGELLCITDEAGATVIVEDPAAEPAGPDAAGPEPETDDKAAVTAPEPEPARAPPDGDPIAGQGPG